MDYLIGLLWSRGQLYISSSAQIPSRMILNINARFPAPWMLDVSDIIRTRGPISIANICNDPTLTTYVKAPVDPLTKTRIRTYLQRVHGHGVVPSKISKNAKGEWEVTNLTAFNKYVNDLRRDIVNFNLCLSQAQQILTKIVGSYFRNYTVKTNPRGTFNIKCIQLITDLDPYALRTLIANYSLPVGAQTGLVNVYEDLTDVPLVIQNGKYSQRIEFLRGVADAIGTLEGRTPRGRDARIKFDIIQVAGNLGKVKSVNLCHFVQDKLNIPIQMLYIRTPDDSRPHLIKIWAEDLRSHIPLWVIKRHYQQRLDRVLRSPKATGTFCPNLLKRNIRPIVPFIRNPSRYRNIPAPLRCYNYCDKIRTYCNQRGITSQNIIAAFRAKSKSIP